MPLRRSYCGVKQGKIVDQGPPAQIVTPELVETLYGVRCTLMQDPQTGTPVIVGVSLIDRS